MSAYALMLAIAGGIIIAKTLLGLASAGCQMIIEERRLRVFGFFLVIICIIGMFVVLDSAAQL